MHDKSGVRGISPSHKIIKTKIVKLKKISTAIKTVFALCIALISVSSCIQDEPLNAECDIVAVILPDGLLNRQPRIDNDKITLIVKKDVSVIALAPEFELTPGATIEPPSGTVRNFLFPQKYVVTSQDGQWSKEYTVTVQRSNTFSLDYGFENVRQKDAIGGICSYDVFYEVGTAGNETLTWASANPAFALTLQGSTPSTFPTYQVEDGVVGKCVALTTRSTGSFGNRAGKPMAAGNLFIGDFDMENAMNNPLQSTHFGAPFENEPAYMSGYYKYVPGETYCEPDADGKLVPVPGKTDMFNLYAVLFEVKDGAEWLDGTNVLAEDNQQIISTATLPDRHSSSEWVEFNVPFVLRPGKSIDKEKLSQGKYSLAIVFSSSEDGDFFCGAIGSTLWVDEVSISCVDE